MAHSFRANWWVWGVVLAAAALAGFGHFSGAAYRPARELLAGARAASWASASPDAPLETHYSPAEDLEAIDVGLIGEAGDSIDIAAYVLTDVPVIDALREAAERGVTVRVFRFPSSFSEAGATARALAALAAAPGVSVRFKRGGELMHLKSYCVDGGLLRAGAANFSASGLKRQDNDLWILRGPGVCARFEADFAKMWEG